MSSLDAMATERRLVEQFLEVLRALPRVSAELEPSQRDGGRLERLLDAQVVLTVAGKPVTLLIEVKKALYPRYVRQILWRFKELSRGLPKAPHAPEVLFVVLADSISPGAQELLRDEWVGYYDSGGSLFLPAHGIYLYIDKPMARVLSKSLRSLVLPTSSAGGARASHETQELVRGYPACQSGRCIASNRIAGTDGARTSRLDGAAWSRSEQGALSQRTSGVAG